MVCLLRYWLQPGKTDKAKTDHLFALDGIQTIFKIHSLTCILVKPNHCLLLLPGGPADGLLQIGDELCEVDGEDMSVMRHSEARNHIKFLPSGHFSIKIRRFNMSENDEE